MYYLDHVAVHEFDRLIGIPRQNRVHDREMFILNVAFEWRVH